MPVFFILYHFAKGRGKNYVLLIGSFVFYGYGGVKNLILLAASILCNYILSIIIANRKSKAGKKVWLTIDIALNVVILATFKYIGFLASEISKVLGMAIDVNLGTLPIGISFYTFQILSYVIDVYWGRVRVQKNLIDLALYISMFPQLVAGPIVRYKTIENEISKRSVKIEDINEGSRRFLSGLCKKVLIANNISVIVDYYFASNSSQLSILGAWAGAVGYSMQIYYDFSGYSDMAIGLGRMMGFHFAENFNYPYISGTFSEFWRRWHISLGEWFRDYVYIPLGGSRVGVYRHILNLGIVWVLTGIWHGASYTFWMWGFFYFVFICMEKFFFKPWNRHRWIRIIYRFITIVTVVILWVLFRADSVSAFVSYLLNMAGIKGNAFFNPPDIWMLGNHWMFIIAGLVFSMPILQWVKGNESSIIEKHQCLALGAKAAVYLFGFLWSISYLVLGNHNPFIYFSF